ncbi:MAG: thioredoxin family protein [Bacteroidetes bacterium]|nr:MAG: thioredoxin family protein [Bacteroidota bacterium]
MKTVKVLGTGCAKCKKTIELINSIVAEDGLQDVQVEKVEDIQQIMQYNVLATPAVVIDEKVVSKGRVPSPKEIREWLTA